LCDIKLRNSVSLKKLRYFGSLFSTVIQLGVVNFAWTAGANYEFARYRHWHPKLRQWFTVCCNPELPTFAVTWTQASYWWCHSSRCSTASRRVPVTLWPV